MGMVDPDGTVSVDTNDTIGNLKRGDVVDLYERAMGSWHCLRRAMTVGTVDRTSDGSVDPTGVIFLNDDSRGETAGIWNRGEYLFVKKNE